MQSGTKAALTIMGVLGAAAMLIVGVGLLLFFGKFNFSGLSTTNIPVVMHDERTLARRYFVDALTQSRMRLPEGSVNIKSGTNLFPESQGGYVAGLTGRSVVVMVSDRGYNTFDSYVKKNKNGISATSGLSNVVFHEEGRCTIQGMDGYVMTVSCTINGTAMKERMVCVDAPGKKVYILIGTSLLGTFPANVDVFDSCFSTFEIGSFAEDPPDPPPLAGAGAGRGPGAMRPNMPTQPPRPAVHTTFVDAAEALQVLQTGQPQERRAALSYLQAGKSEGVAHDQVMRTLLGLLEDRSLGDQAAAVLKVWAEKTDVPVLRERLERFASQDASGRSMEGLNVRKALIQMLGQFGDADSAKALAQSYRNFFVREDARQALEALGASAEPAVLELVSDSDMGVAREALSLLAKIGTEKSIFPLQRLAAGKNVGLVSQANDVIQQIADREKLKPEQYLNNLVAHYVIDAPASFTADNITTPNTRQWSHTAAGRAVKSVYVVSVKLVPKDYRIQVPAGSTATLEAGTITFRQLASTSTNVSRTVHYQALDGEYLIDLTATMDVADSAAGTNMTNAAKKIHAVAGN